MTAPSQVQTPFPVSDHCDGRRFFNPAGQLQAPSFSSLPRWWWQRLVRGRGAPWPEAASPTAAAVLPAAVAEGEVAITFVGHSTFLLQLPGMNILTDPVFSPRAGPFSWLGLKRVRPPALRLDQLPRIDLVLLSHNHYDHLDLPALRWLARERDPLVVTTLGNRAWLARRGVRKAVELDWWQEHRAAPGVRVVCTPAQHFSARTLWDRCRTLWGGFVLQTPAGNVFFSADSGYCGCFKEIGRRLGPFDLALIPIGSYEPRWFMRAVHCNPAEAVQIHRDIRSRFSLAMHFGCFPLADEGPDEQLEDFAAARAAAGLTVADFAVPRAGGTLIRRLARE